MQIRPFAVADYDAVLHVWTTAGLTLKPSDSLAELQKKLERDPDLFLVAEEAGEVIGAIIGAFDGRRGWIYHLAVLPARQGGGVGWALLAEVERRLAARGCLKVNLLVERSNTRVIDFYAQLGYDVDDVIFMGKPLR